MEVKEKAKMEVKKGAKMEVKMDNTIVLPAVLA